MQSIAVNACGIYATAALAALRGVHYSRRKWLKLFGVERLGGYRGADEATLVRVVRDVFGAAARWQRFDPRAPLAKPVLLVFLGQYGSTRGRHAVVLQRHISTREFLVIDSLGPRVTGLRANAKLTRIGRRWSISHGRYRVLGSMRVLCERARR